MASFAPAAAIIGVPATVATFSPAAIRIAPIAIGFAPVTSGILAAWAAPTVIIRFPFGPLEIRAAFGIGHCPARRGYKEKHQ